MRNDSKLLAPIVYCQLFFYFLGAFSLFVVCFMYNDTTFFHPKHSSVFWVSANVNFLVADGTKFTHPLHHLGKSVNDLPVLAIDSFRHMYVFPHDVKTDLG